jgi:hypothetical protein
LSPTRCGSYARVELHAVPSEKWSVSTDALDPVLAQLYAVAIERGVATARIDHETAGGRPQHVTLDSLEESAIDTSDDVVAAATAAALWLELGYPQSSITLDRGDQGWTIDLSPS